jgi:hypothetical protein
MHLFGDPTFPKKNIVGGSLIMAVAGFEFGTFVQRAIRVAGTVWAMSCCSWSSLCFS